MSAPARDAAGSQPQFKQVGNYVYRPDADRIGRGSFATVYKARRLKVYAHAWGSAHALMRTCVVVFDTAAELALKAPMPRAEVRARLCIVFPISLRLSCFVFGKQTMLRPSAGGQARYCQYLRIAQRTPSCE